MSIFQSRRDPLHFRPICRCFLRDDDIAAVWQHTLEAVEHSVGAADNFLVERRVGLIQPVSQTDAARHRIDLGYDVAVVGQN